MGTFGRTLGGGLLGAVSGLGRIGLGPSASTGLGMGPFGGGLVGMMLAKAAAQQVGDTVGKKKKKKPTLPGMPGSDY